MNKENQRFVLNERNQVIDKLNPDNQPIDGHRFEGDPEDDINLRKAVLRDRLSALVGDLPTERGLWWILVSTIYASHLNTFDPALSIQNRFDGTLKREKKGVQAFTSLSLFIDDVERLLRDLYGDIESEALESLRYAIYFITKKYLREDLLEEDGNVEDLDYGVYHIGVFEGYGVGTSLTLRGMGAGFDLQRRAREVLKNPSAFSKYTVEFANRFGERFKLPEEEEAEAEGA